MGTAVDQNLKFGEMSEMRGDVDMWGSLRT